jgi:hypothetical protein
LTNFDRTPDNRNTVASMTVVERVLSRMPDYKLDLSAAERCPSIGITNGWKYTLVTFTPGSKVGAEF